MAILFLPKEKFRSWLSKLSQGFTVFYPTELENKTHYKKLDENSLNDPYFPYDKTLKKIRAIESIKGFFFKPNEKVGGLERKLPVAIELDKTPQIIFGAKNCDLRPLMVHQKMYLENEFGEPFYKAQRERTFIIAADCPVPEQTCFCNLLGLKPYPELGADIVITIINNGYIFETTSEQGEKLLRDNDHLFSEAGSADLAERDAQRQNAVSILETINPKQWRKDTPQAINERKDEEFWQEQAKDCVECFGCLMVCPTCFCFLLIDQPTKNNSFQRNKIWDACYYSAYARVGGGMTPRPEFWKRFRNRFHCKFMNFTNDYGFNACSGCGRCFSVCMGKIDIRKVLDKV